ncbi:SPOR domain-containing protein [Desulfuromonas sp. DDH964]|uniref:hypothetical protein n=1 Tax=Desulfuromonas sp. DDH964 TaxID=1823759 RepID=UPI00078DF288|nr:hypothetical protein [Desulfuromonas sp. DDH964]AMV71684.1 SPOR domain-containing protein [Desulfuromonas sp. DDH964]
MADKDDFTFEEEETFLEPEAPLPAEPTEEPPLQWESEPEPPPAKSNSLRRILLLLLLLIVLAGAAFYFLGGVPEPEPRPAVVAKKQTVTVPAPPAAPRDPAPVAAQAPAKAEPAAQPAAKPEPAATAKVETAPVAKPAAPAPAKEAPPAAPVVAPVAQAAPAGEYTLRSGAYLLQSSIASAEKVVRKLGYEPVWTPIEREVAMTRLKVGSYAPAEAAAKVAELASVAPDAFILTRDGQATVYAGSYLILDKGRRFADQLYRQGIRVEEEPAMVRETLQQLSFGDFADRQAADAALARAKAAGLAATVSKRP